MRNQAHLHTAELIPDCCRENLTLLLLETAEFLNDNDVRYWIDFGTLLGVLRDDGVLPWDRDVDFSMLDSEFPKLNAAFAKHGDFNFGSTTMRNAYGEAAQIEFIDYTLESGLVYMPSMGPDYFGNSAKIPRVYFSFLNRLYADIYTYCETEDKSGYFLGEGPKSKASRIRDVRTRKARPELVTTGWCAQRKNPKKYFDDLESIDFRGVKLKTPSNPKEYLSIRYGPDWETPDPTFYKKYPPGSTEYTEMCKGNF